MIHLFDRNSTKLTISEFYDNYEQGKYNFEVDYQRKSGVWSDDKRSFLIDTILKNYPIPPIFMQPNVDNLTGKTKYDIVDGKQRLQSIISFIEGDVLLPNYFSEDDIFEKESMDIAQKLNGKSFAEIQEISELASFVKQFWTYSINIDYLYEGNRSLISNIFDRLNRNGEPLNPQELRNAKYNGTLVLKSIKDLSTSGYWHDRFSKLKSERMEDEEFLSELFFLVAENSLVDSSPEVIDGLYNKYKDYSEDGIDFIKQKFSTITLFLESLKLNYEHLKKLSWTTHLYGLFSFAWYCVENEIKAKDVSDDISNLYTEYFDKKSSEYTSNLQAYKNSCSSNTRSKAQRERRLKAILDYCEVLGH